MAVHLLLEEVVGPLDAQADRAAPGGPAGLRPAPGDDQRPARPDPDRAGPGPARPRARPRRPSWSPRPSRGSSRRPRTPGVALEAEVAARPAAGPGRPRADRPRLRQPDRQRPPAHAAGRLGPRRRPSPTATPSGSTSATPARGSPPSTCRGSSRSSTGSPARARPAAPGSAWRSPARSSPPTAARSTSSSQPGQGDDASRSRSAGSPRCARPADLGRSDAMDPTKCVLIVDDEPNVRLVLPHRPGVGRLPRSPRPRTARPPCAARASRRATSSCSTSRCPDGRHGDAPPPPRPRATTSPVVIVTAHGSIPDAVAAMKLGAIDFLTKPLTPERPPRGSSPRSSRRNEAPPGAGRRPAAATAAIARRPIALRPRAAPSGPSTAASSSEAEVLLREVARPRPRLGRGPRTPRSAAHDARRNSEGRRARSRILPRLGFPAACDATTNGRLRRRVRSTDDLGDATDSDHDGRSRWPSPRSPSGLALFALFFGLVAACDRL